MSALDMATIHVVQEPSSTVAVYVNATDVVVHCGITKQLEDRVELTIMPDAETADVSLLAVDEIDGEAVSLARTLRHTGSRVVVVASKLDEYDVVAGMAAGAVAFCKRADANADLLVAMIQAASEGVSSFPTHLVVDLFSSSQISAVAPTVGHEVVPHVLTDREIRVLQMAADGFETAEIAQRLSYSERTVKGILHGMTSRLKLKNRTQAVAYALRNGVIS